MSDSSKNHKRDKCFYHQCNNFTTVYTCKYCGHFFCRYHIKPKPPCCPNFNARTPEERQLMEIWRDPRGHPCPPYLEHWEAEKERSKEEYRQGLERFLSSSSNEYDHSFVPVKISHEDSKLPISGTPNKEKQSSLRIYFLIFAFLLVVGFYFYSMTDDSFHVSRLNCSDGTSINSCSVNKPHYCVEGALVAKSSVCGCPDGYVVSKEECSQIPKCSEGTIYEKCSLRKPLYCNNGSIVPKASICGCPEEYRVIDDNCEKIPRCNDSTIYDECSVNVPLFCFNGTLVNRSSICGCPEDEVIDWNNCISKFKIGPKEISLQYTIRNLTKEIHFEVYSGLNDYLKNLSRTYYCDPQCPSQLEIELRYLDNPKQNEELKKLVKYIKDITPDTDDQVRIAVSLVQEIPYDSEGLKLNEDMDKYPYEVIYSGKGVCGEKSRLLAFLLRELGFDVILLDYISQEHMAVGIKCPIDYSQYSYNNVGYCFIEASNPSIITDNQEEYVTAGNLSLNPGVIHISDGKSFANVSEEFYDAQELIGLNKRAKKLGNILPEYQYNNWKKIVDKYGLRTSNNTV